MCRLFAVCDCVHGDVPGESSHIFPTWFAIVAHIHLWYEVRHTGCGQVWVHTTQRGRVERGEVREVMQKAERTRGGGWQVIMHFTYTAFTACRNILGLQLHTSY